MIWMLVGALACATGAETGKLGQLDVPEASTGGRCDLVDGSSTSYGWTGPAVAGAFPLVLAHYDSGRTASAGWEIKEGQILVDCYSEAADLSIIWLAVE